MLIFTLTMLHRSLRDNLDPLGAMVIAKIKFLELKSLINNDKQGIAGNDLFMFVCIHKQ
jgi:hypothetical protein